MVNILIAGDYSPAHRCKELLRRRDYESVFGKIKETVEKADYSIVNFETTVAGNSDRPILKCGPNLRCDEHAVEALQWVGFDLVTLANNHFYDYGEAGLNRSFAAFEKYGLEYVGAGRNLADASRTLFETVKGLRFAFINVCEHEFSIADDAHGGSHPIDPIVQYYQIHEARKQADHVVLIIHGGHETYPLPSPRMQDTYRFFINAGADAVINHHQHCPCGYEIYNGKPIFYGIGNFCFDWRGKVSETWHRGYMVQLVFSDRNIRFELHPYVQAAETPGIVPLNSVQENEFLQNLTHLNQTITDRRRLVEKFHGFAFSRKNHLYQAFAPYTSHYALALYNRKLIPSFLSKKRLRFLYEIVSCEAHRDTLTANLHESANGHE